MSAYVEVTDLRRRFDVSKPWLNRVIEREPRKFLTAVDRVGFAIEKGETFAIVGESGSGKSTVARMVVGLLPPSAGEVTITGVSMTDPRQAAARAVPGMDCSPSPPRPRAAARPSRSRQSRCSHAVP